jgi:hypothetical protein
VVRDMGMAFFRAALRCTVIDFLPAAPHMPRR